MSLQKPGRKMHACPCQWCVCVRVCIHALAHLCPLPRWPGLAWQVLSINGQSTQGLTGERAARLLRGTRGTEVRVQLARRSDQIPGVPGRPEPMPAVQYKVCGLRGAALYHQTMLLWLRVGTLQSDAWLFATIGRMVGVQREPLQSPRGMVHIIALCSYYRDAAVMCRGNDVAWRGVTWWWWRYVHACMHAGDPAAARACEPEPRLCHRAAAAPRRRGVWPAGLHPPHLLQPERRQRDGHGHTAARGEAGRPARTHVRTRHVCSPAYTICGFIALDTGCLSCPSLCVHPCGAWPRAVCMARVSRQLACLLVACARVRELMHHKQAWLWGGVARACRLLVPAPTCLTCGVTPAAWSRAALTLRAYGWTASPSSSTSQAARSAPASLARGTRHASLQPPCSLHAIRAQTNARIMYASCVHVWVGGTALGWPGHLGSQ